MIFFFIKFHFLPVEFLRLNLYLSFYLAFTNYLSLNATKGFKTYNRSNGGIDDSLIASAAGLYKLTATDFCGNIFKVSIYVKLMDTSISVKSNQVICLTDTVTIKLPTLVTQY